MRTRKVFVAVIAAAAMALAACSSTSSGTDAPSGDSSQDSSAPSSDTGGEDGGDEGGEEPAEPTSDAEPPAAGGSITVGAAQGLTQLNPVIRTFAWEEVLFPLLWNGLTKTDQNGDVVSDLATAWESSDDLQTWTFTLRDGVSFSDGSPFTSQDVVDTFHYYLQPDTPTQEANKIATVDDVSAPDENTVTFTLSAPNALFPSAIVWVKMLKMSTLDSIDKNPIGTGPYTVSDFVPDDHLTLVRNDNYFDTPAALDEIKIVAAPDAASAASSLASGDLDVLWALPLSDVDQYEGNEDISIVLPQSPSQWPSWEVDATAAPFDNVKARQALAYAVDRQQILEAAYYGQGEVSPTNNPLGVSNPWFVADGLTDYSYDLDKAKALFAEAGVNEGDTLTWWGIGGAYPEWETSGQILQASLKQIGINLKIENNDIATWVDAFYPAGKSYPGYIVPNFQSTPVEPAFSINFLLMGRCECNWDNADFANAYTAAVGTGDADDRKAAWGKVQQIVNEQVPVIVPLQSNVVTAVAKDVTGLWVEGGGQLHLESAGRTGS